MLVLGIDPGSRACGYAFVRRSGSRFEKAAGGVVRPKGEGSAERLADLMAKIGALVEEHAPDEAALERVFFGRNARSALVLGQARGVVMAVLASRGLPVAEYTAAEIKKAVTGRGSATKEQVRKMVEMMFDEPDIRSADESDALAVAVCHLHRRKFEEMGIVR